MYRYFLICSVFLNYVWSEPFFQLTDKPIFFCFKVCPLYCSQRRSDEDAGSLIYFEDEPHSFSHDIWMDDEPSFPPYPYHFGHFVYCKPKTTTTTPKPTTTTMATTTEEPSFICMVCKKKCDYPKS
ncbi:hypothetical protein PYW07_005069 [Mythimna separata]|uniref:Uncharacterized protein n=1 Tax=Mythimna separata TaxID=271217 RepID=A0AAD7YEL7_MYTSE|nr:hypothetical protein PYW07_005069 [Mythimna separata]